MYMDHPEERGITRRVCDDPRSILHPSLRAGSVHGPAASNRNSKNNNYDKEREHASSQRTADVVHNLGYHQPINSSLSPNGVATASKLPGLLAEETATEMAAVSFRSLLWRHCFLTITYCCVFLSFGMGVAFLGPTIFDLGCRTGNVFSTMTWVFFSQTLFTLVGSASGGWLASRFPKHRILLLSVFFMATTLALIPSCTNLGPLVVSLAVMGFFMGTIDTIANLSMIQLYGVHVGPFLQALHFFYGLGAFLALIIVEPFLLNVDCSPFIDPASYANTANTTRPPYSSTDIHVTSTNESLSDPIGSLASTLRNSRVQYAFLIMAMLQVPVIVLLSLVVLQETGHVKVGHGKPSGETFEITDKNQIQPTKPSQTTEIPTEDGSDDEFRKPEASPGQIFLLTALAAVFLFLFDSFQAVYGNYVYSLGIKTMRSQQAAYLNALFWGMFALGRLFSIAISTYLNPQLMLLGNITGCLFGVSFLMAFYQYESMLYSGTAMIGLFLSSVSPTSLALVESYINITPPITTCIVVSAAAGEIFMPVIVGHEFGSSGPNIVLVNCLIFTILSFAIYICLLLIGNNILRYTAESGFLGGLRAVFCRGQNGDSWSGGPCSSGRNHYSTSASSPNRVNMYARMKSSESSEIDLNSHSVR